MTDRWSAPTPNPYATEAPKKSGFADEPTGPASQIGLNAPSSGAIPASSPWQFSEFERNKPWTDEELNRILPSGGYEVIRPPDGY